MTVLYVTHQHHIDSVIETGFTSRSQTLEVSLHFITTNVQLQKRWVVMKG